MARSTAEPRELIPGSTGWSVRDLDDPRTRAAWEAGRFQIIEGVLAIMPPAYWDNSSALRRLVKQVERYLEAKGIDDDFGFEVDVVVGEIRVPKVDAVYMSRADKSKQAKVKSPRTPKKLKYGRLCVPPTLVIENISKGHESEDRVVKRAYYAEASIPNYWILDVYERSLECLVLKRKAYALDQLGRGNATVTPVCFPGLSIDLKKVWGD